MREIHARLHTSRLELRPLAAADLAGFGGYWFFHEPPRLELLFGLAESQWGKGLATELASALITFRLTRCGFREILARTDAPNVRSVRLLTRLGFVLERQAMSQGLDTLFFRYAGPDAT